MADTVLKRRWIAAGCMLALLTCAGLAADVGMRMLAFAACTAAVLLLAVAPFLTEE